MKEKEEALRR